MVSIIIPVAGIGRRMKSYGPKSLINLGNSNLLSHQIACIREVFINPEIILVSGFEYDKIDKFIKRFLNNIKVIYNNYYYTTNVAYSISLGLKEAQHNDIIVILGDLFFNVNALHDINIWQYNTLLIDKSCNMDKREVGVVTQNDKIVHMAYGLEDKWAQIMLLQKKASALFQQLTQLAQNRKAFTFQIINQMIEKGVYFDYSYLSGASKVVDIDIPKDIERAENLCRL
jgi:choline kinase